MKRPAVTLERNPDGSWTATIYSSRYEGTYEACAEWLHNNNEQVPAPRVPDSWLVPPETHDWNGDNGPPCPCSTCLAKRRGLYLDWCKAGNLPVER